MSLLKRLFGLPASPNHLELRLFVEAMLLMMAADGQVADAELSRFVAQIRARPEFQGITQDLIERHMKAASAALKKEGAQRRVEAMARGLAQHEQRMAAVTMALSTSMSHQGHMSDGERLILKTMQQAFGLSEHDLDEAIDRARQANLARLLDDRDAPPEQFYVEAMMLMAAADGELRVEEMEHFGQQLAYRPEFERITAEQVGLFMERSLHYLDTQGMEARLRALAERLTEPSQRLIAVRLALELAMADGGADERERALLALLQKHFALPDAQIQAQIDLVLRTAPPQP